MPTIDHLAQAADREHAMPSDAGATLFAALELSLTSWVVVASAPGQDGASKHTVAACDGPELLALLNRLRSRAGARCGHLVRLPSRSFTFAGCTIVATGRPMVSRWPFAALDHLLGRIAARATGLRCFDRLAVDHTRGRTCLATGSLANVHQQHMIDRLPHPAVAPRVELALHRCVGRANPWAAGAIGSRSARYRRWH